MLPKDAIPDTSDGPEPTDEQWQDWCGHPVTRYVAKAFKIMAEEEKTIWANNIWSSPKADPDVDKSLVAAKSAAKALQIFITAKKEHYVRTNTRAAEKPR